MFGEDLRLYRMIKSVNGMSEAERREHFELADLEACRPARLQRIRYTPDLTRVPSTTLSGTVDDEAPADVQEKAKQLLSFIKSYYGPRCADAARAVMSGAATCKEIGDRMGVRRNTAICHMRNLQSLAVQKKAIELGLVTRDSFIKTVVKPATRRKRRR